jgi:hypothetical protein
MHDAPTSRFGTHVQDAGVHHNPTAGPADGKWLYGHNWVCLARLARHPAWGAIALPLPSLIYIREGDVAKLAEKCSWAFHTKHELGVKSLTWFMETIRVRGLKAKVWLAVDGTYAVRPFLPPVLDLGSWWLAACARMLVCLTCLQRVLMATVSTTSAKSVWRNQPGIVRAGKRSLAIVVALK